MTTREQRHTRGYCGLTAAHARARTLARHLPTHLCHPPPHVAAHHTHADTVTAPGAQVRQRIEASDALLDLVLGVCFLLFIFHLLGNLYCVICREEIKDRVRNGTDILLISDEEQNEIAYQYVRENGWLMPEYYFVMRAGKTEFYSGTYIFCVWWAMCAMSGAQVSIPQTDAETLFTFLVVFLGFFVNA